MLNQKLVQTIVGFFMLLGIFALLFLALKVSGLTHAFDDNGYNITANFQNVGSLKPRAPITVAGVKVGYIEGIKLNPSSYEATVTLHIYNKFNDLPLDTSASIYTEGLLGSNYISLSPGYDTQMLHNGSKIQKTHSALILENLIGQFMYKVGGKS